jgi:hypothetical protein
MRIIIGDVKLFREEDQVSDNRGLPYMGIIFGKEVSFNGPLALKEGDFNMRCLAEEVLKQCGIRPDSDPSLYMKPCLYFTYKEEEDLVSLCNKIKRAFNNYNTEQIKLVSEDKIRKILLG